MIGALLLMLGACNPNDVEKARYYSEGMYLYEKHCLNCHGDDGRGLGELYPPLVGNDYVAQHKAAVVCGIKWGMAGEIVVDGITYNQPMPGHEELYPLEIAELITYIQNSWGNEADKTSIEEVEAALKTCRNQQ